MMYIQRLLNLPSILQKKSFFLFGPRATGKTSLIYEQLGECAYVIDLLDGDNYLRLLNSPSDLEKMITAKLGNTNSSNNNNIKYIVIDEVQKIPMLLNQVHRLIESKNLKFILTGSSARRLKQERDVNLLAGRAWEARLFPLVYKEIIITQQYFDLDKYLNYGGLPAIYNSEYPAEDLKAYVNTYLKDEIQTEARLRKIQAFTKFINFAALTSGQLLNYTNIASDAGVTSATIREYYQILEDTLLGTILEPWHKTIKRKSVSSGKFYFFDVGVMNRLSGIKSIEFNTDKYGFAFEHFIFHELRAYINYSRKDITINFWCTKHGQEVDFIIDDRIAIEVKSSKNISQKHLKNLKLLQEEKICEKFFLVCLDSIHMSENNIEIMHWEKFINLIWEGQIF